MSELLKRHDIQVLRRAGHSQPEGAVFRLAAEVLALDRSLARAQRAGGDSGPRIKSSLFKIIEIAKPEFPEATARTVAASRSWVCP